jgi:phosphate transport system protein
MIGDPGSIKRANDIIWIAHHSEHLRDRVTNICERLFYMVTGEYLDEPVTIHDFTRLNYQS